MSNTRIAPALVLTFTILISVFGTVGCGKAVTAQKDSGFSQLDIQDDSATLKQAANLEFSAIQNPSNMGESVIDSYAQGGGAGFRADCGSFTQDATDADGDGIPRLRTWNYNACPIVQGTYSAVITVRDNDDHAAMAGFQASLSGLVYEGTNGGNQVKLTGARNLNLSRSANAYAVQSGFTLDRTESFQKLSISSSLTGMYVPTVIASPWQAGALKLQGTMMITRTTTVKTVNVLLNNIQISSACLSGPVSGSAMFSDVKNNVLKIVYSSCGQAFATYNGSQVL